MTYDAAGPTDPRAPHALLAWSNVVTYAAVCFGIAAVLAAFLLRSAPLAAAAIAAAVICDTLDGAFARRFARTDFQRAFGAQLDSLADAIASGAAPPLVLIALLADRVTPAATAILALCAGAWAVAVLTRLAFYNLTAGAHDAFTGIPAPLASLLVATALLWPIGWAIAAALMLGAGVAMVMRVRIPRPRGAGLVLFTAWPALVLLAHLLRSGQPLAP